MTQGTIDVVAAQVVEQLTRPEVVAVAGGDLGTLDRYRVGTLCSRLHDAQNLVEAVRVRCLEVTR